jgi:hypothetical protein
MPALVPYLTNNADYRKCWKQSQKLQKVKKKEKAKSEKAGKEDPIQQGVQTKTGGGYVKGVLGEGTPSPLEKARLLDCRQDPWARACKYVQIMGRRWRGGLVVFPTLRLDGEYLWFSILFLGLFVCHCFSISSVLFLSRFRYGTVSMEDQRNFRGK